jgi:hypothetical protein
MMFVCVMVFNVTFNNISVISWWSVLLVEEIGGTGENHRPVLQDTDKFYHIIFTVFRLLTDFVCLYTYEFLLSLCKIVRSSVILLLPLFIVHLALIEI